MNRLRIVAVRPYSARIRSQVFATLEALGARVETAIEEGATDDEAVEAVRGASAHALLIPFHAHRDRSGALVHGLRLIERIRAEIPVHASTPILCPISTVGLAAAGLLSARIDEPVFERVLFIHEDELDEVDLPELIERFLLDTGTLPHVVPAHGGR